MEKMCVQAQSIIGVENSTPSMIHGVLGCDDPKSRLADLGRRF